MGRKFGEGLKYMRLAIDVVDNHKIDKMESMHGDAGFAFVIKLMCRIFKDSYYMEMDDDNISHFCRKQLFKPVEEFDKMLASAIKYKIFDKKMYEKHKILTSKGIQNAYLDITKRWQRVKFIEAYKCEGVNIDQYHLFICNVAGLTIKEQYPSEIAGSRPPEKKKPVQVDEPEEKKPVAVEKPVPAKVPEPVIPPAPSSNLMVTYQEVNRICSLNWEDQSEEFKKQVSEGWHKSYIEFNKKIDDNYPQLRLSNYQITIAEYKRLLTEPIDQKKPTKDELYAAMKKLAANGVKIDFNLFYKLQDYVGYVRNPNAGRQSGMLNGTPALMTAVTNNRPVKIDHTADLDQWRQQTSKTATQ
jgi:hypothetical protein